MFVDKINVTSHLQCAIEKEINKFYHHIPLKKEKFDETKITPKIKTKKNKTKKK